MLKVQINRNDMKPDIVHIAYNMVDTEDIDFIDEDKMLVTCYHDGAVEIHDGDEIVATYTSEFGDEGEIYSHNQYYNVISSDDEELFFTLQSDKYFNLESEKFSLANVEEYVEETDEYIRVKYLYVYFKNHHFFNEGDYVGVLFPDETIIDENDEIVEFELSGEVYGSHTIRFRLEEYENLDCNELTDEDDIEVCNGRNGEIDVLNAGIRNNIEAARFLAQYCGINNYDDFMDELDGMTSEYNASEYRFLRYNFMFYDPSETDKLELGVVKPSTVLKVPLFSKIGTDLNQETNVNDRFTKVEIKKAINPIDDMEKDVYTPVYTEGNKLKNVGEIRFNLHFRQHRGDDWTVEKDSLWNGIKPNGQKMTTSNNDKWGFFSYPNNKISSQSDLLSYLGFTDSDVKYRKNKLKMSFLRLSFYDSMLPTNQNLLAYSTVFVDTGRLYGKYTRNFEYPVKSYSRLDVDDEDGETKLNLTGSRVNREPYWSSSATDIDAIEAFRLSSQFIVKDKYSSDSSSEGFYLYLWKSMTTKTPSDIYMKVEFNHAGFGRTIPFMMPYKEVPSGGTVTTHLETFEEILEDWATEDGGYEVQDYIKYSYIHLKYVYDENLKRCIYYVDKDLYGTNGENGIITFNLYEGRAK